MLWWPGTLCTQGSSGTSARLVGLPAVTGCASANQDHSTKMGGDIQCQGTGAVHEHTQDCPAGPQRQGQLPLTPSCTYRRAEQGDTSIKMRGTKSISCSGCQSGIQAQPLSEFLVSQSEHLLVRCTPTPSKRHMNLSLELPGVHHSCGAEKNTP